MTADHERLEELWHEYLGPLVRYAMRRCDSRQDAMDVVAEVFLVAWRRIERVPAGPDARLWLFTVARNVVANQRRGKLRRSKLAERLEKEVVMTVADHAAAGDAAVEVKAALASLSERNRELILLVAQDGLTPSEAASVLGIPASTARVRLHRVRAQLRSRMERSAGLERSAGPGHVHGVNPLGAPTENLEVI